MHCYADASMVYLIFKSSLSLRTACLSVTDALPVPEDREQYSQDEDGGDDEQVVADYLLAADGGATLGPPGAPSSSAATMPDAAPRNVRRN